MRIKHLGLGFFIYFSGLLMRHILLLFIILLSFDATAQKENITQQLEQINQQSDKTQVAALLAQLLASKELTKNERIDVLMNQSQTYIALNNFAQALTTAQHAKQLASDTTLLLQQAQANKLIGIICYLQGHYGQALTAYQAALNYWAEQTFTSEIAIRQANLLNNIALVQTSLGDSIAALESYQKAEPLYQRYGDEVDKIDVRYNLAGLYISLRRYDIAIDMLREVIAKRQAIQDEYGIAQASGDLGVSYKHSEQYKKAEQHILKALNYFQNHNYPFDEASQLHNIAEVYYELSQVDKAFKYATLAVQKSKNTNHQKAYGGSLQTLAKIFFHQGNINQSREYLEQSNKIAEKMGYQELMNENNGLMSIIYAAEGETEKALAAQLYYQKIRLKLSNEKLNENIAKFESDQLTQQIKNLKQSEQLQQLELTKVEQQRHFIILGVTLILLVLFLVYRRHLEATLTKELETRVMQRTEALEFLTQELQNANMIKSQFLANMSHEIRTPLTAVIGQAEAIIHGDFEDKEITEEVNVIHSNSLHLLQLINDILDLSKIEANKFELENRKQNIHEIVDNLNDIFVEQARRKNLSFTITHHLPNPFIIDIDGLRLKQILINLCSNAIKFTSEGWVTLDIAIIDKMLLFTVTDTGIGMNESQISKVFNMFTQADNSISRRFSGSGLGLFLSEQLAKVMSGSITVTSQLNHGSTFELKLPFGKTYPALTQEDVTPNIFAKAQSSNQQYTGKILLADDHDDNRRLIARLLKSIGLEVIEAKNGKEALSRYCEHYPTVILLDIQMPEMDGIQALDALRKLGCNSPIYAFTANAMSHEIAQYLALGFSGHLKKPIERGAFLATITQHFSEVGDSVEEQDKAIDDLDMSVLIMSFVKNLSKERNAILQYSRQHEHNNLARVAHKIAGAASMFGFVELSQSAIELEKAIKSQRLTLVKDLIDCLLDEINLVQHQNMESIENTY